MLQTFNKARCCCPIGFYQEINAVLSEKIDPINDQNSKNFPILNDFIQFLLNFSRTSLIRMLKTVKVGRISCPVGFSEKIISIF